MIGPISNGLGLVSTFWKYFLENMEKQPNPNFFRDFFFFIFPFSICTLLFTLENFSYFWKNFPDIRVTPNWIFFFFFILFIYLFFTLERSSQNKVSKLKIIKIWYVLKQERYWSLPYLNSRVFLLPFIEGYNLQSQKKYKKTKHKHILLFSSLQLFFFSLNK